MRNCPNDTSVADTETCDDGRVSLNDTSFLAQKSVMMGGTVSMIQAMWHRNVRGVPLL
jgi:hypothetical protein